VRATALRIRVADIEFADPPDDRLTPGPGARRERFENLGPLNFGFAMEMSMARGETGVPGPAAVWFRLAVPVVAGEETTPLMRVAAAADFGNGISGAVTWDEHLLINPDLTIYLHRLPAGTGSGSTPARGRPTRESGSPTPRSTTRTVASAGRSRRCSSTGAELATIIPDT
jgi:Acyl-CoA thioesterase C-terminal domain